MANLPDPYNFPTLDQLKKQIAERQERRKKLKEAWHEETKMKLGDYDIEVDIPLDFNRSDVARNLVEFMNNGESVLVKTDSMVHLMAKFAKEYGHYLTTKKEDDGKYRVWLIKH